MIARLRSWIFRLTEQSRRNFQRLNPSPARRYARTRMAHYIVRAKPKPERIAELHTRLCENAFVNLRPFGKALTYSLTEARTQPDGTATWEEEDYCSPPLAQERAAVLDRYFDEITVEQVNAGEGWKQIEALPKLNANG